MSKTIITLLEKNSLTTSKETLKMEKVIDKYLEEFTKKSLNHLIKINWSEISSIKDLSDDFVIKYSKKLNWWYLNRNKFYDVKIIDENFIEKYKPKLSEIVDKELTEEAIRKNFKKLKRIYYLYTQQFIPKDLLNEVFIEKINKNDRYIIINILSSQCEIDLDFILIYLKKLNHIGINSDIILSRINDNENINKKEKDKILNYFKLIE
jgi:hypothetical protein